MFSYDFLLFRLITTLLFEWQTTSSFVLIKAKILALLLLLLFYFLHFSFLAASAAGFHCFVSILVLRCTAVMLLLIVNKNTSRLYHKQL